MKTRAGAFFKKAPHAFEWKLLVFLILFMDVKLVFKVAAIILIYVSQPDFRFGFGARNTRLPLFYLSAIGITVLNWILNQDFSIEYTVVVITGIGFWMMSILAIHQVKLIVDRTPVDILHNTIRFFFLLNIAVSLLNLITIFWEIGFQNPFHYQGEFQKYFTNTGDHIRGITFDTSTTNALINAFGVIYFLSQRKYAMLIGCMSILVLTASNFTNIILTLTFLYLFFFKSDREQKSIMVVCMMMLVIFHVRISPENSRYISESIKKYLLPEEIKFIPVAPETAVMNTPDSTLTVADKKERSVVLYFDSLNKTSPAALIPEPNDEGVKHGSLTMFIRPEIPADNIHAPDFQSRNDTSKEQRQLISFMNNGDSQALIPPSKSIYQYPGKIIGFLQAFSFFRDHPQKIATGTGTGNFSSKLAFRASGLNISGGYPNQFTYINKDFLSNHLALYSFYYTKNVSLHSITNYPASVYGQLLTEYGIAGLLAFFFFYVGFFMRRMRNLSYGIPLLLLLLPAFVADYWFEQLSVVVLFELMMFVDMKQNFTRA